MVADLRSGEAPARRVPRAIAAATLALWLLLLSPMSAVGQDPRLQENEASYGSRAVRVEPKRTGTDGRPAPPVGASDCGPGALPETGLQGQVPVEDQLSGRSKRGYRCNVELIGQNDIRNRGANFQMAWYRDCAYVGTSNQLAQTPVGGDETDRPLAGVAVIDASRSRKPDLVRFLKSPVGQHEHEALDVNQRRGMLVMEVGGIEAQWIEIYDISENCRKPVFMGRYDSGQPQYHGLEISSDGKTVYASNTFPDAPTREALLALDVSDMSEPKLITTWDPTEEIPPNEYGIHDLALNRRGTRAYLGVSQQLGTLPNPRTPTMVVLDTSGVERRVANPDLEVVSLTRTQNFGHSEMRATIDGEPYIVSGGELPLNGPQYCPWAWGNLINISDEEDPEVVSAIKLEVNELSNCPKTTRDSAGYSIHYGGVDDPNDTKRVFFTWYMSGLRIFDVGDPRRPREIGYYVSPPKPDTVFEPAFPLTGVDQNARWDQSTSVVRYRRKTGEIWFVSVGNGFQIVKSTDAGGDGDRDNGGPGREGGRRGPGRAEGSDREPSPSQGRDESEPRNQADPVEADFQASPRKGEAGEAEGGAELPFTGFALALTALAGATLVVGGVALHRLRRSRERA